MTSAWQRRSSASTASTKSSGGTATATASETGREPGGAPGTHQRTMPAPARWAPVEEKRPAPSMPAEPATSARAERHLLVSAGRGASQSAMSRSSTSHSFPAGTGIPICASSTSPASSRPAPMSRPGFKAAIVTVVVARTEPSLAMPVSQSSPDGMSMATTGVPAGTSGAS